MAFLIYDYSNTNITHRKALLRAIERLNAERPPARDLTLVVSTRNAIKALPRSLLPRAWGGMTPIVNFVGFGRLYSDYGVLGRFVVHLIIRLYNMTSCAGFIVEHETDKECLERLGVARVFASHGSGLDASGFRRSPKKSKKPRSKLRVGYMSRFHKSKGSDQILKAAEKWPKHRELIIVGWDIKGRYYSDAFGRLAAERDNIQFLGKLESRQQVSDFFNSIDIFLSPSRREGGNISLQESIWHGVPFLTTNVAGCDVLAKRFGCPAIALEDFAQTILSPDLDNFTADTSKWDALLKPFMTNAVQNELYEILKEIARPYHLKT